MKNVSVIAISQPPAGELGQCFQESIRGWTTAMCISIVLAAIAWISGIAMGMGDAEMFGTTLIALSFALLYFAAHCIDRAGAAKTASRRLRLRELRSR